jgi:Mn2+/Fe2+ NRAMP family transporter
MIAMMHMTGNQKIMRSFRIHDGLRLMGWLTTTVMAVAAIIMCVRCSERAAVSAS